MTLGEALAEYESGQAYVQRKCLDHGIEYKQPSADTRWVGIYDTLAGDFTSSSQTQALSDPQLRLRFWTSRYQQLRSVANADLTRFLLDRIKDARRGK